MNINVIVALSTNWVIGNRGKIPWKISSDLRRFKKLTTGHPIIMGRKTHESIGRVLPNRLNIVISRNPDYKVNTEEKVQVCGSVDESIDYCGERGYGEIFFIGGQQIYEQVLPLADYVYMTTVLANVEGDAFFPDINASNYNIISSKLCPIELGDEYLTVFSVWERK